MLPALKEWHLGGHALVPACVRKAGCARAQGGRLFLLPAVKEGHHLSATFVFPPLTHEYRAKAEDYISHFVGHEGKGSLLSTLKVCAEKGVCVTFERVCPGEGSMLTTLEARRR